MPYMCLLNLQFYDARQRIILNYFTSRFPICYPIIPDIHKLTYWVLGKVKEGVPPNRCKRATNVAVCANRPVYF